MIYFLRDGLALHIHTGMPWPRFGKRFFQISAYAFVPPLATAVRINEREEPANIIRILLMQVAVIGNDRVRRVAAIVIFILKSFHPAMYAAAVILESHEFPEHPLFITQTFWKTVRVLIELHHVSIHTSRVQEDDFVVVFVFLFG